MQGIPLEVAWRLGGVAQPLSWLGLMMMHLLPSLGHALLSVLLAPPAAQTGAGRKGSRRELREEEGSKKGIRRGQWGTGKEQREEDGAKSESGEGSGRQEWSRERKTGAE